MRTWPADHDQSYVATDDRWSGSGGLTLAKEEGRSGANLGLVCDPNGEDA